MSVSFEKFALKYVKVPSFVIVLVSYVGILLFIYIAITMYVPDAVNQLSNTLTSMIEFYENNFSSDNEVIEILIGYLNDSNIFEELKNGAGLLLKYISSFSRIAMSLVAAFFLSFLFMIEKKKISNFSKVFLEGEISWFFEDIVFFAKKFINTFGVVIEAQIFIAICNTVLTTISLMIFGFHQTLTIVVMIFVFSLIPVAGAVMSTIPLCIIAFYQNGINGVLVVLITVIVVHFIEAYFLNPKFMSSKTNLPIFFIFIVLFVSSLFMGNWGFILGIPIFTFILDLLKIDYKNK